MSARSCKYKKKRILRLQGTFHLAVKNHNIYKMPLTQTGIILIPKEFCNVVEGTQLVLGALTFQVDKHTKYRDLYIYLECPPSNRFAKLITLSNLSVKQMETHRAHGQ